MVSKKSFVIWVAIAVVAGLIVWGITDIVVPHFCASLPSPVPPPTPPPLTSPPPEATPSSDNSGAPDSHENDIEVVGDSAGYLSLSELRNIADGQGNGSRLFFSTTTVRDNYGNEYSGAYWVSSTAFSSARPSYKVLLDEKFSRFQAVYFIKDGESSNASAQLLIRLDDVEIYSVTLDKTSRPHEIDIDVSGGNVFELEIKGFRPMSGSGISSLISNAVFHP